MEDSQFTGDREQKTVSWLREIGVSEDVIDDLPFDEWEYSDSTPRNWYVTVSMGREILVYQTGAEAEANRKVWVTECYIRLDVDGDGYAELRRIVVAGNHILSNETWDQVPYRRTECLSGLP